MPQTFKDPFEKSPLRFETDSTIAVAGHPLHAMLVAFPIALTMGAFGGDVLYWLTGDAFFARLALWASGSAFGMGLLAALSGIAELVFSRGLRWRIAVWTHFIAAVMLLSTVAANWGLRLHDYEAAVLPWGLLLSALAALLVVIAGWHGGKLVFEHQIGVSTEE